jgi:hypothetical protein
MTLQGWLQIGLTFLLGFLISIPVGSYLARVVTERKTLLDGMLDPFDNFIYLLIGRRVCSRELESLYAAYAGNESDHGLDHFSSAGVSGSSAAQYPALRRNGTPARVASPSELIAGHRVTDR